MTANGSTPVLVLPESTGECDVGPIAEHRPGHLTITYEVEGRAGLRWTTIVFEGVVAVRFTPDECCTAELIDAYSKVNEVPGSRWEAELREAARRVGIAWGSGLRHLVVFFDHVGAWEVLAAAVKVVVAPPEENVTPFGFWPSVPCGGGVVELAAPDRLVVRHGDRNQVVVAEDLAGSNVVTFHCRDDRVFVVGEESRTVWLVDVPRLTARPVAELDRLDVEGGYDPGGMHRVVFHDLPDGVLVEYEIGVARLRTDGSPVWEHVHEDVTMRVRELTPAAVNLAGEERSFSIGLDDGDLAR